MIPDPYILEQVADPWDFAGRCGGIEDFLSSFDGSMGNAGISVNEEMDQMIDFRQELPEMWGELKDSVPAVVVMLDKRLFNFFWVDSDYGEED